MQIKIGNGRSRNIKYQRFFFLLIHSINNIWFLFEIRFYIDIEVFKGLTIMEIPDEMLKEIRESGYDQELVYSYIRELLNSDKQIKENNNLELIDNYLLDKDTQELSENAAEIVMAAELIDNYLLDKRFIRELEDRNKYDAA